MVFFYLFLQRSASVFFPSSSTAYLADMNGQKKGGCGHFMAEWDQHVSCPAYLADMNGQRKGGCGHFMAEWDQHVSCPAYLADMNGQRKDGCDISWLNGISMCHVPLTSQI